MSNPSNSIRQFTPNQYLQFLNRYCLPKQLLSTHFWSLQQRHDFALQDHKKCVQHFRPTFRCMQARVTSSESDEDQQDRLSKILSKLASGVHPTVKEILDIKILFLREPFHLNCLYPRHKVKIISRNLLACSLSVNSRFFIFRISF